MARSNVLLPDGSLNSGNWIDHPNALYLVERKVRDPEYRELVRHFIEHGYVTFDLDVPTAFLDDCISSASRLWDARPSEVLAADITLNGGRPVPMSLWPGDLTARQGCRILDAHSHVEKFIDLATNEKIIRLIRLMTGSEPVATQSLYFPYGSVQPLHRDPWYVVTTPIENLCAVWIALEDIVQESGPLSFLSGSHRIPWKPLSTGDVIFHAPGITAEDKNSHIVAMNAEVKARGLTVSHFTTGRARALLWHAGLIHGGSVVTDHTRTRHSLVVHYDAAETHPSHAQSIAVPGIPYRVVRTEKTYACNNARIFENPCVGQMGWLNSLEKTPS